MNQLSQLIQEILDFSTAIDHSYPDDHADYQQACHLFCDYIEGRISQLSRLHHTHDLQDKLARNTLNTLSMPAEYSTQPYSHWINTLFSRCHQLQNNKPAGTHPSHRDKQYHSKV